MTCKDSEAIMINIVNSVESLDTNNSQYQKDREGSMQESYYFFDLFSYN